MNKAIATYYLLAAQRGQSNLANAGSGESRMKNILIGLLALIAPAFFMVFLVACGSGGGGGSYSKSSSSNSNTQSDTTKQAGAWSFSTIDSNMIANGAGFSTSLAFDSNGKMHIAYRDMVNEDLKYATNASGTWVTSTIDSTGDVGMFCQLSLDSNNNVHISYSDNTTRALKYANNVSGTWVISAIDSGGWYYDSSIAIDSNNKVHISYGSISGQMYITNVSGAWVKSAISGMGGYESSIAVDTNNNVHIAGMGKYATNASGVWVTIAIVTVGSSNLSSSIVIDNNNKVHIGYTHSDGSSTSSNIEYATNTSGAWVTTTLATSVVGTWYTGMSMTVDANNKLHLCYQYVDNASSDDGLQYATNVSGSWEISGIITQGMAPSIKLDSSNKVDISFIGSFMGSSIGLQIAHLN